MRRPQFGRLQDRRSERLLRRSHTRDAATPRSADEPGGAVPIRGGALRPEDGLVPPVPSRVLTPVVSDAA